MRKSEKRTTSETFSCLGQVFSDSNKKYKYVVIKLDIINQILRKKFKKSKVCLTANNETLKTIKF